MVYTFHITSIKNSTESADKKRIKKIGAAFSSLGHKIVIDEKYPGDLREPPKACKGENDVFVCIVNSLNFAMISDHTGYKNKDNNTFTKKIKNANIMYVFWGNKCEDVKTSKVVGAPIGKNGKMVYINNPAAFLKKHNITWVQGKTDDEIVNKIRTRQFEGSGLSLSTGKSSSTTKETTTTYTITEGFNSSEYFRGYLAIKYSVYDNKNKKIKDNTIYIDWSGEAPDISKSKTPKFDNPNKLIFNNNEHNIHEVEILSHIKSVEDLKNNKNQKYYLKSVSLIYDFEDIKDDKKTTDKDESKLYDDKNDSSYKVNLYHLGVFSGELINRVTLGVSGKTLLDGVKNILDTTNYLFNIKYGRFRNNDTLNFKEYTDTTNIIYTFNEGFDGDIIEISNVKYSPTSDLINNAITVYKSYSGDGDKTGTYRYTRKSHLNEVLRYGEQTHIENLSESTGFIDASQRSYDNLIRYFKPDTTLSVTVAGLPPVNVNDYVATKTINPLLTNEFTVHSREISINVDDRPMIQTTYGLGDVDYKLKIKNNLAKQRRDLIKTRIDINTPVTYKDSMTDELIDNVWV